MGGGDRWNAFRGAFRVSQPTASAQNDDNGGAVFIGWFWFNNIYI